MVLDRCNEVWAKKASHLLRAMDSESAADAPLTSWCGPLAYHAQGRWSSQSFLGYLAPMRRDSCTIHRFSFQSHESILSTMSTFKIKSSLLINILPRNVVRSVLVRTDCKLDYAILVGGIRYVPLTSCAELRSLNDSLQAPTQ